MMFVSTSASISPAYLLFSIPYVNYEKYYLLFWFRRPLQFDVIINFYSMTF